MTICASPPTCAFRSTTTRPNATSGWPRSSRRCPDACAPSPAPRTSPRCAPTYRPRPNTAAAPSTSSPNSPAATSGSRRPPEQSRVGPNELHAGFGRDAAHGEWFYGFRLAVQTDLGSRLVRAWSIVPAAVNERDAATDLLETGPPPRDLLADKGFDGRPFAAAQAARGTAVLTPPTKAQRARMPAWLQAVIACWRNRVEVTFGELTDRMELARHGAHTFWGLLTRTAATIAAHTLLRVCLADLEVA